MGSFLRFTGCCSLALIMAVDAIGLDPVRDTAQSESGKPKLKRAPKSSAAPSKSEANAKSGSQAKGKSKGETPAKSGNAMFNLQQKQENADMQLQIDERRQQMKERDRQMDRLLNGKQDQKEKAPKSGGSNN